MVKLIEQAVAQNRGGKKAVESSRLQFPTPTLPANRKPLIPGSPTRRVTETSFVSEGHERIDSHGTARGDVSRESRYRGEKDRDNRKCRQVVRRDAEEHVPD